MLIFFHRLFKKDYDKVSGVIKDKFNERLLLFVKNEFDPILRNHALKGKYNKYRSINITGDFRALYYWRNSEEVRFVHLGTHANLYD